MAEKFDKRICAKLDAEQQFRVNAAGARRIEVKTALFRLTLVPISIGPRIAVGDYLILRNSSRTVIRAISAVDQKVVFSGIWPSQRYSLIWHQTRTYTDHLLFGPTRGNAMTGLEIEDQVETFSSPDPFVDGVKTPAVPMVLEPIALVPIGRGAFKIRYSWEPMAEQKERVWLCLEGKGNRVALDITEGYQTDQLADLLALFLQLRCWGQNLSAWLCSGDAPQPCFSVYSNHVVLPAPVEPLHKDSVSLDGIGTAGLVYAGVREGRLLTPSLENNRWFKYNGLFEIDPKKRGFDCTTYVGFALHARQGMGGTSEDLANELKARNCGMEKKQKDEVRAFFERNMVGTYIMWNAGHVVAVKDGFVHEFSESHGGYRKTAIAGWHFSHGPFFVRRIDGTQSLSARPIYVIAHRCNGVDDVDRAISAGANAVECDIRWPSAINLLAPDDLYVEHDFCNPLSTRFDRWLETAAAACTKHGKYFALIIFDMKTPDANIVAQVHARARAALPADLNIVFSIADFDDRAAFDEIKGGLTAHDGLAIDADNDPVRVQKYFASQGIGNCWYGNGIFVLGPGPNVEPSVRKATALRDRKKKLKKVYVWTLAAESSINRYLKQHQVDGIMVNYGTLQVAVAAAQAGGRLANRADPPFTVFVND